MTGGGATPHGSPRSRPRQAQIIIENVREVEWVEVEDDEDEDDDQGGEDEQ